MLFAIQATEVKANAERRRGKEMRCGMKRRLSEIGVEREERRKNAMYDT